MLETEVLKVENLPEQDVAGRYSLQVSEDTLSKLGEFLKNRFQKLQDLRERSDWEIQKAADFNDYHMVERVRPLPFAGAANLPCPLARIGVDSFHANVMSSVFADGNQLSVKPLIIQKEFASTASKAAKYMTYVMNHEVNFYNIFDDVDHKHNTYGISYMEPSYVKKEAYETRIEKKTVKVPKMDPQTKQVTIEEKTTEERKKEKVTVFDGCQVDSIPVENIYKSPFLKTLKECVELDVVFKRFDISYHLIKERAKPVEDGSPMYRKTQVDKIGPYVVEKMYKALSDIEQARADNDGFYLDLISRDHMVEMAQAYLWYDIDDDNIREEITATFHPASGTVVRVSLSKCRIVEIIPRPVDERGYGEGIPRILQAISDEWENFHNTRSNAGQWENMPFFFYRAGGRLNPQQYTLMPGHGYPVDNPQEVVFPQTQRVGSSYFQEEQMILSYFERILALDENMQGVGSSKKRTATENLQVQSRASIRFGNPFNRIVGGINELLQNIWELNQECAPESKEFYVIGEGGVPLFETMNRTEYSAKMKFSVGIQSVFDRQLVRDTCMLAYRLFMANPYFQQHPELLWELSQKTLDSLNIDIDIPKPMQMKTTSAFEAIELLRVGKPIEPEVGVDYDHQIQVCMDQLNADDISEWDHDAIMRLMLYIDKLKILKQTLEDNNLNKSGQPNQPGGGGPPGGPPGMQGQNGKTRNPGQKQPGVTANRNPTQMFNTMKVGETGPSAIQNNQNAINGQMNEIMGQGV